MSALEEIEAIKRLKHRYLRCLDLKLWDEMRGLFHESARSAYDGGRYTYDGREEIVGFMEESLGRPEITTLHQVHHPEIDLQGPTSATGIWHMFDWGVNTGPAHAGFRENSCMRGAAFYRDEYVKIDGEWKIQFSGYDRIFEEQLDRSRIPNQGWTSRWG